MVLPRNRKKDLTLGDMLASVGTSLSQTAYLPNINNYTPWFKQEWFHKSDKHGRLFIGGNRTGKTVSNVVECIRWITKTHPYREMPREPVRGRFVTVDFKNFIKPIIIPMFQQWLPSKYLFNGKWEDSYDKETDTLHLTNGSFLEFMSYEQELDKFAGASRHFVAFDEEPDEAIWNECLARLIDTYGYWWMSMTPLFGMTWVYKKVYKPAQDDPNFRFFMVQADMAENPYLSDEAREEYLATLSPADREAREHGNFVQLGGNVHHNFSPQLHKMAEKDFRLTSDMRVYTSVDQGWAHPAGWLWHAVTPKGEAITFYEMRDNKTTIEGWAHRVRAYENTLKYADTGRRVEIFQRTGDPALRITSRQTGLSDLGEYAKHGIFLALENVPSGPGSVDVGLQKLDQYFQINPLTGRPTWRYTDNCYRLEEEMLGYHWETWASKKLEMKNAPKTNPHKKDDDLCDSLRYFVSTLPELSFDTSVPTEHVADRLGSVQDYPVPITDTPDIFGEKDYRDYASLEGSEGYQLHDSYSSWDMEW